MTRFFGGVFLIGIPLAPLRGQVASWDLPPVRYSDTPAQDRVAQRAEKWAADPTSLHGATALDRVRSILAELQVPEASQILVFSKTSKQNGLIRPSNPRALYFSLDVYCGYVPGGALEIVIQDMNLGPVFYVVDLGSASQPVRVERDASDCLSCHATGRTEHVPGLLVRSVYPDEDGQPLLALGSGLVTHQTAIEERWGGYYVTGTVSRPHLGNRTYQEGGVTEPFHHALHDLKGRIDTAKYPTAGSDVVALMVLEHQCQAHNLLTAAAMNYKRAHYLANAMNPDANPDEGTAGRVADHAAQRIVEWFLFKGEAGQGEDGVEGDDEFQSQFDLLVPRTAGGDSLADFHLNGRLFKNRCSYMVYSAAFKQLPAAVKSRVIGKLRNIFEATAPDDNHPDIKLPERRKIATILAETGVW